MEIINDVAKSRFLTHVNGVDAQIIYRRGPSGAYDLVHTLVPKEAEGRGVAGELVKFALATAKAEEVKIVATCPYVKKWFEKHPEERAILI